MHSTGSGYLKGLYRLIRKEVREVGIKGVLRTGVRAARNLALSRTEKAHSFDLKYGTDTSGIVQPWALSLPGDMVEHAVQYRSAIVDVFIEILQDLSIPYEDFVFVDLGSGKGRAILLASLLPFKEIIGVELSPPLHEIACRNIEIFSDASQRCRRIRSVQENVVRFEIPDEPAVLYLFNPFDAHIMRALVSNIERSLERRPRKLFIAYLKPVHRHVFDQSRFVDVVKDTDRYVIYGVIATGLSGDRLHP